MSILTLCIIIISLFSFGALNSQNVINSVDIKLVQPTSNQDTNHLISKSEVNAKKTGILSVSAKCSCSLYTNYEIYDPEWLNYCPECHRHDTLVFDRPEDCPEGMMRCTYCDADFCAVHGKEHIYGGSVYLIPA